MNVAQLSRIDTITQKEVGESNRHISAVFCCDLLSVAMAKAPVDSVWVTVMGNRNTLAVATLAGVAAIILADGATFDEATLAQAKEEGIAVYTSEEAIFPIALRVHQLLN